MASVSSLSSRSVTSSGISHVQFVDGDGEGQVGRGSRVISQPSAPNGIHSHPPGGKSVFGSTQSSFESRHSASPESPRLPAMAFARCDALISARRARMRGAWAFLATASRSASELILTPFLSDARADDSRI